MWRNIFLKSSDFVFPNVLWLCENLSCMKNQEVPSNYDFYLRPSHSTSFYRLVPYKADQVLDRAANLKVVLRRSLCGALSPIGKLYSRQPSFFETPGNI